MLPGIRATKNYLWFEVPASSLVPEGATLRQYCACQAPLEVDLKPEQSTLTFLPLCALSKVASPWPVEGQVVRTQGLKDGQRTTAALPRDLGVLNNSVYSDPLR